MINYFFKNLYVLIFFNGILVATLFSLFKEDIYEKNLFSSIANNLRKNSKTENKDTFLIHALHMANSLQVSRYEIFKDQTFTDNIDIIHSASTDLMTAYGACGSYSIVLARILKANGCIVRMGQMKVNGQFGGHIIVETKINNKWIIIDPTYNLAFINPDNTLATFKQVHQNWDYFKKQLPSNYDSSYSYSDIRYTNWDKIPIVMPLLRKILVVTFGEEKVNNISIRPYFLRGYHVIFILSSIVYVFLSMYTFWIFYNMKKSKKL